jgi:DNA polymerase
MAGADVRTIVLASGIDLDAFRAACRRLAAAGVAPDRVVWQSQDEAAGELFADGPDDAAVAPGSPTAPDGSSPQATVAVPAAFLTLCESVILHRDPGRFALMYRLLWRLRSEPSLRHDPIDPDRVEADRMAQAVRRDMHKMKAFVRFRPITALHEAAAGPSGLPDDPVVDTAAVDAADLQAPVIRHVAWFEPEHHIVEAVAPFFARRFAQMQWSILTPERSVRWDGHALAFGPGARREDAPPADGGEQLWLTYYESIFNPARLKLAMMQREMPRRYWRNLPEAQLISPLSAAAAQRSMDMIAKGPTPPSRRRPVAGAGAEPNQPVPVFERPTSLPDLAQALDRCRECPIGELATQAVPGEGPKRARLMFVGEQPGDQEDVRGRPFVGPAGQLLDRAFAELGWPRDAAYVTNAVKHFKFELRGKRRIHKTPAQQEAAACLHWLESEIELVQPEALVALGATAARQVTGRAVAVMRERGTWVQRSDGRRVLITLHPSALLRTDPSERDAAYAAWLDDLRHADRLMRSKHPPGD